MKKTLFTLFCLGSLILFSFKKNSMKTLTINEAVSQGLVRVKVMGAGGHSGECLSLDIQNLKDNGLSICFKPGHRFNSSNEDEQDLLIVKEQVIVLNGKEKKPVPLSAFCCQLHNKCPMQGSGFKLGKAADANLVKLSNFLNTINVPNDVMQEAVWCVSNDNLPSSIALPFNPNQNKEMVKRVDSLRKFVCKLTNKPDCWYSTPQERRQNAQRIIVSNPVEVFGSFSYEVKTPTKITMELVGPDGVVISKLTGREVKTKGKWDYNFQASVTGYPPGVYHVILKAASTQILDKEFTI
jgi:hypothetical protein